MKNWSHCKNVLCIRPDNMGDLIMSGPAIRALKQTFSCKITVLTSSVAAPVVKHMPGIDDMITFDLPWVKTEKCGNEIEDLINKLKRVNFDAAVIFTVYSQSALPSAMLAWLAGIRNILAYCRENPYGLISHWVPEKEPYEFIKHQVERDLELVKSIGAVASNEKLQLLVDESLWQASVMPKLSQAGVNTDLPWMILHAGVSEKKRAYPKENWVEIAKILISKGTQVLFTGSAAEKSLTDELQLNTGEKSFSLGGVFNLAEFICLIKHASVIISVNTGSVHIAAAVGTPLVVLYAQTNPQHTPWQVASKVLTYSIPQEMQSRNQVIARVNKKLYQNYTPPPTPNAVIAAIEDLMKEQALVKADQLA